MDTPRAGLVAAVATNAVWIVKAVVIAVSGEGNSPAESVTFLLGLACCVVAAVLVGLALTVGRSVPWRVAGVVLTTVAIGVVFAVVQAVVVHVQPPHPAWVWGELNLWAGMLALLAAAVVARRRAEGAEGPTAAPSRVRAH